ncbi:hypothetical protein LTS12_028822, partial [Elasticomyces elasticus]
MSISHTASKGWFSEQSREYEAFSRARCNYGHIAPLSPVLPRTWSEWIKHRIFVEEGTQSQGLRRLAIKKLMKRIQISEAEYEPPFADKTFEDHLSSVLARESIWLPSYTGPPDREQARWPTHEEMKLEVKYWGYSRYRRSLPLPRVPHIISEDWTYCIPIEPFEFDAVGCFDTEEALPETDENMHFLVGKFLLR